MKRRTKTRLLPMDELQYRPCEVDGVPALFHRWIEDDRVLTATNGLGHYIPGTPAINVIRETFALVEFLDGVVVKVKPEQVRFVDREETCANDKRAAAQLPKD